MNRQTSSTAGVPRATDADKLKAVMALEAALGDLGSLANVAYQVTRSHFESQPSGGRSYHMVDLRDADGLFWLIGEIDLRLKSLDIAYHAAIDAS